MAFRFKGILLAATAGFFSSSGAAITKLLTGLHPLEIVIFRDIVQLVIALLIARREGASLVGFKGERRFLVLRAIFGSISLSSWYLAVRFTIFGDAGAIYYSYPPLITLFAWLTLREPFGWYNAVANLLTVSGILVISGPRYFYALFGQKMASHFSENDTIGLALASLGCIAVSAGNLSIRFIQKTPSSVIVVWFSLISGISSALLVPVLDEYHMPHGMQWLFLAAVGLTGLMNQYCITLALKVERAAPVAISEGLSMVYTFLYQIFVFREPMQWNSVLGAAFILSAVLSIGFKKYLDGEPEPSRQIPTIVIELDESTPRKISFVHAATS